MGSVVARAKKTKAAQGRESMLIVDSQVHLWHGGLPPPLHRQIANFTATDLLKEMDEAGVSAAIICPPTFCPDANRTTPEVVRRYPGRLACWGSFDLADARSRELIKTWMNGPEMLGARFTLNLPHQQTYWDDGTIDWLWPAAEALNMPIGLAGVGHLDAIEKVAERHPRLRMVIDQMAARNFKWDDDAYVEVPQLVKLARFPNVAVKVSHAPCFSSQPYPFRNVHVHIRKLFDAYGPRRTMWGSDLTRMPWSYRLAVTMFTEEMPWLSGADLEWVMGRAACEWLGWKIDAA